MIDLTGVVPLVINNEIKINETNLQLSDNEEYVLETLKNKNWNEFSNYKFKTKIIQLTTFSKFENNYLII